MDLETLPRDHPEMLFTAEEVAATLDPGAWEIMTLEAVAGHRDEPRLSGRRFGAGGRG